MNKKTKLLMLFLIITTALMATPVFADENGDAQGSTDIAGSLHEETEVASSSSSNLARRMAIDLIVSNTTFTAAGVVSEDASYIASGFSWRVLVIEGVDYWCVLSQTSACNTVDVGEYAVLTGHWDLEDDGSRTRWVDDVQ